MNRTLPDARWDCRGCGACCHGFAFGPVEPEVIAGLEKADIASQWPPAASSAWAEQREGPDGTAWFLTHRDGHCVFLQDDQRCAVHRLLGEAAKPWFCREFPMHAVITGRGTAVIARPECEGLHASFADGAAMAEHAAAALALPRPVPRQDASGRDVVLWPGAAIDGAVWDQVEDTVLGLLEGPQPVGEAIHRVRNQLASWARREPPDPDPDALARAEQRAVAALRQATRGEAPPAFRATLNRLQGLLDGLQAPAALDEDAQRYEALVVRSDVLTHRFGTVGGLPALLGLWWLESRICAGQHGEGALTPADVGPHRSHLRRGLTLPPVWATVKQLRPVLETVFLHAR